MNAVLSEILAAFETVASVTFDVENMIQGIL